MVVHVYCALVEVLAPDRAKPLQALDVTTRLESRPVPLTTRVAMPPAWVAVTLVLVTVSGAGAGVGGGGEEDPPPPPQAASAATEAMVTARVARRSLRLAELAGMESV